MLQNIIAVLGSVLAFFLGSKSKEKSLENKQLKRNLKDLQVKHEIEKKNDSLDRRKLVDGL
jgi:hypothetical protein